MKRKVIDEMDIILRWEPIREKGRGFYLHTRGLLFFSMPFILIFAILLPLIEVDWNFEMLLEIDKIFFTLLSMAVGYGFGMLGGNVLWKRNEELYALATSGMKRIKTPWDEENQPLAGDKQKKKQPAEQPQRAMPGNVSKKKRRRQKK